MPRSRRVTFAALLLLGCSATMAHATQVVQLDTRGLVRSSHDIVIGEVTASRSYWNPEHSRIFTDITVRIAESLKGAAGTVTLTQMGGEVDGAVYSVPGSPVFKSGEEALQFLWRDSRGRAQVNGLAQGKFDIRRDAATGTRTVQRSLPGLEFRDTRRLGAVRSGERVPAVPLNDLVSEVRRVIAEDGR